MQQVQNRQDILQLVWLNGGNNVPTMVFHEDGGHGWLQIPQSVCKELGIVEKISGYSYKDKANYYLEEDCDFSLFMDAIGIPYDNKELCQAFWEVCPKEYHRNEAPMRRMARAQG